MIEMLNRQLSSSSKKQSPRSPLRDLNGSESGISTCSSSSVSIEAARRGGCLRFFLSNSSASKTKTTPHNQEKALLETTPKSAPNVKSLIRSSSSRFKKPLTENLPKSTSQNEKSKKPSSKTAPKSKPFPGLGTCTSLAVDLASGPEAFSQNLKHLNRQKQKHCQTTVVGESSESKKLLLLPAHLGLAENSTPVGKIASGSVLGCELDNKLILVEEESNVIADATTKTPPVQASVSPEIQCGLVPAATPACYGAGHIVSGVTDRRKCRARGILAVGETDSNCGKANTFDDLEIISESRLSLVPVPVEASMHWLLSPCDEEDKDQKSDPEDESNNLGKAVSSGILGSIASPSSGVGISSDSCTIFGNTRTSSPSSRMTLLSCSGKPASQACSSSVSPLGVSTPTCEAVISCEKTKYRYDLAGENSPFSLDSLGSGNVIQTPQSDFSSDGHVGMSWFNAHDDQKHELDYEIDSVTEFLLRERLSPNSKASIWDPLGLSFQLSDMSSPTNSIDLAQHPNRWNYRASGISNSTMEDMSWSQMRISWRDGLASRIFEMDEFDCCRCLSDDENDSKECSKGKFKSSPSHELQGDVGNLPTSSNGFGSPEFVGEEPNYKGQGNYKFVPDISNLCAESVCTDDGGLVASGDSDWSLCYKNQLFEL